MTAAGRAVSRLPIDAPSTSIYSAGFLFEGSQMAIDDLGRHPPGANRIIVPTPPPMVLPERKIISATEAARWHEMRGGAVAAEEEAGDPILLPGLIGWALTSGPEQTLDSSGVIASGPLDLTAVGSPTYGADGVVLNGSTQYLNHAYDASFDIGDGPALLYYEALCDSLPADNGYQFVFTKGDEFVSYITTSGANTAFHSYIADGDSGYPDVSPAPSHPISVSTRYLLIGGPNLTTLKMGLYGTGIGSVAMGGGNPILNVPLRIGSFDGADYFWNGKIRRVRLWIGANAATIIGDAAIVSWLYNSGAGRTDQEVAEYTG
jgi:hypothetical protein